MSIVFDTLQKAIATLAGRENAELFSLVRFVLDALHESSHAHEDWLNVGRVRIAAGHLDRLLERLEEAADD